MGIRSFTCPNCGLIGIRDGHVRYCPECEFEQPEPDPQQLEFDLEETRERLSNLINATLNEEAARELVKAAEQNLRRAKQALEEARRKRVTLAATERRRHAR